MEQIFEICLTLNTCISLHPRSWPNTLAEYAFIPRDAEAAIQQKKCGPVPAPSTPRRRRRREAAEGERRAAEDRGGRDGRRREESAIRWQVRNSTI